MPAFRGKQIFKWIHQGADFDEMTNLPLGMRQQLKEIAVAQPVEIILNPNEVLRRGDSSPYLHVAQALLLVLSEEYDSIGRPSQNGILDENTFDALSSFQSLSGLPMTGELDKVTWKHLALHFPLAANRGKGQSHAQGRELLTNY